MHIMVANYLGYKPQEPTALPDEDDEGKLAAFIAESASLNGTIIDPSLIPQEM
jgi:hypothetical protein